MIGFAQLALMRSTLTLKVLLLSLSGFLCLSAYISIPSLAADLTAPLTTQGLQTITLQKAIDDCARSGGGKVFVPAGRFVIGTIRLKSGVTLSLNPATVLLGSTRLADYDSIPMTVKLLGKSKFTRQLIYAEGLTSIGLEGGTIDGQGYIKNFSIKGDDSEQRPFLIRMVGCKDVTVKDISLTNPAYWTQCYQSCDGLMLRGLRVLAHANRNNDGLDLESCKNVTVSDCIIDADDDALCLKSSSPELVEFVTVTNCILASNCNAIKMGTASVGGFRHVTISNCVVRAATHESDTWKRRYGLAGIALESVDGGLIEYVDINHITMEGYMTPIFIRRGARFATQPGGTPATVPGEIRQISISDLRATSLRPVSSCIMGIPGYPVREVSLHNISIESDGKGRVADYLRQVPEVEKGYPENKMFGPSLPAHGLYIRHGEDISVDQISLTLRNQDARPAIGLDDVKRATISHATVFGGDSTAALALTRSTDVNLTSLISRSQTPALVQISEGSERIMIRQTQRRGRKSRLYQLSTGLKPSVVTEADNQVID